MQHDNDENDRTGAGPGEPEAIGVLIETELGSIEVELRSRQAPVTVENFLEYVDGGWYDGGRFHRTVHQRNQPDDQVRIEVIQGGVNPERASLPREPIALERTTETGLSHVDGAISMARFAPDSAESDFFICINDQPELDFGGKRNPDGQGFAAFGRVESGMEIVRRIQASAAEAQSLTPAIRILRIRRQDR
ncbi:MAG: peptidylprolyl isomerase [Chloroflexota bacterium]|nr:peptidylprolyl isomerase [Chloroflexota bacterium]